MEEENSEMLWTFTSAVGTDFEDIFLSWVIAILNGTLIQIKWYLNPN